MPRILGLDIGEKRIGVAVSDETCLISNAIETISVRGINNAIKRIRQIAQDYNCAEIVAGLPLNMNGTKGPQAQKVLDFLKKLEEASGIKVETFDERLTTAQGEAILLSADMSRKKRKQNIDKFAAQIILQAYLDCRGNVSG
jgi:putative holliday junction resolvase